MVCWMEMEEQLLGNMEKPNTRIQYLAAFDL